jgi:hypothetical protein
MGQVDIGKVVLQDQRTGDVYVDKDGNLKSIEGTSLVIQECINALKTIVGEEVSDPNWGFDLFTMINNPFLVDNFLLITSLVMECLDPEKIGVISDAVVLSVLEDPDNEGTFNVSIQVTARTGDVVKLQTGLGG